MVSPHVKIGTDDGDDSEMGLQGPKPVTFFCPDLVTCCADEVLFGQPDKLALI